MCGSVRNSDAETTVFLTRLAASSKLRYELMVHQAVDVKEYRELFDSPSFVLNK
jgi:hypothetical protein